MNPVVTIPMNRTGIKFLIADFEMMFGRSSGKAVQALCISKNWPLVWARNPRIASICQTDGHLPNCSQGCWNVRGDCQALPLGSERTQCTGGGSCSTPGDRASQRILDPEVLVRVSEGHNCTSGVEFDTAKQRFHSAWLTVNQTVLPSAPVPANAVKVSTALHCHPAPLSPLPSSPGTAVEIIMAFVAAS